MTREKKNPPLAAGDMDIPAAQNTEAERVGQVVVNQVQTRTPKKREQEQRVRDNKTTQDSQAQPTDLDNLPQQPDEEPETQSDEDDEEIQSDEQQDTQDTPAGEIVTREDLIREQKA